MDEFCPSHHLCRILPLEPAYEMPVHIRVYSLPLHELPHPVLPELPEARIDQYPDHLDWLGLGYDHKGGMRIERDNFFRNTIRIRNGGGGGGGYCSVCHGKSRVYSEKFMVSFPIINLWVHSPYGERGFYWCWGWMNIGIRVGGSYIYIVKLSNHIPTINLEISGLWIHTSRTTYL